MNVLNCTVSWLGTPMYYKTNLKYYMKTFYTVYMKVNYLPRDCVQQIVPGAHQWWTPDSTKYGNGTFRSSKAYSILWLSLSLERSGFRIFALNALRLDDVLSSLVSVDQINGHWYLEEQANYWLCQRLLQSVQGSLTRVRSSYDTRAQLNSI